MFWFAEETNVVAVAMPTGSTVSSGDPADVRTSSTFADWLGAAETLMGTVEATTPVTTSRADAMVPTALIPPCPACVPSTTSFPTVAVPPIHAFANRVPVEPRLVPVTVTVEI